MTVKTREQLQADIDTWIFPNNREAIKAAHLNDRLTDIVDSAYLGGDADTMTVTATDATTPRALADSVAERGHTLADFGADTIGAAAAFNAAQAAGVTYVIVDKPYNWTAQATVSLFGTVIDFRDHVQTKAFNGWPVRITARRCSLLYPRWFAQGDEYTGGVFTFSDFREALVFQPYCTDLSNIEGNYFLEVTAPNLSSRARITGGTVQDLDGSTVPHIKLYGNAAVGDSAGSAPPSIGEINAWIDLGGSREARVHNIQGVWPKTYSAVGAGGTHNAHFSNCRFTDQGGEVATVEGAGHVFAGIVTPVDITFNATALFFGGSNNFAGNCTINGSIRSIADVGCFQNALTFGPNAKGFLQGRINSDTLPIGEMSKVFTLADDTVGVLRLPGNQTAIVAIVFTLLAAPNGTFLVRTDAPGSSNLSPSTNADIQHTTGVLTNGTGDGTDAKFNISPHTDGNIYFKNRLGVARNFVVTVVALGV